MSLTNLAGAQTASTGGDNATLEEIIITAEKRETNLQETPIAVAAVSNEDLTRAGVAQLANLTKVIPDIKLDRQGAGMTVSIRGVYSTDNSPTSEAANAMHVNGAYLAKTNALDGFIFDIARFEVSKGPQGTLYGRNANGGAINIITNRPVLGETSASGEMEVGTYNLLRETGTINVPMGETLALRGAFQSLKRSGYMKSGMEDANERGGRLSLLWKPQEGTSLLIIGDAEYIGGKGPFTNVTGKQPDAAGTYNPALYYVPSDPWDDRHYTTDTASGTAEVFRLDSKNMGLTAQLDHDLGFATWTTLASARYFDTKPIGSNNLGTSTSTVAADGTYTAARNYVPQHFHSQSLETRLASNSTKPLEWVVGLYAFFDKDGGTMIGYPSLRATSPSIQIANGEETAKSYAGFGQLTWTPGATPNLHLTAGGRYTHDSKDAGGIFTQFGANAYTPRDYSGTWSKATYKGGVAYDLTDHNMLFANVSTGFKAGGFGYGPGPNPALGPVYAPETITAYEVGSKNRFLDNRLQVNLEAFYYKYKDYQSNLVLSCANPATAVPPCNFGPPVLTVSTAGSATYKGGAVDVQYALTQDDFLRVNLSNVAGKYGPYAIPAPTGYAGGFDKTDTDIPGQPKLSGNAAYSHTFHSSAGSWNTQLASNFRSKTLLALEDDALFGRVRYETGGWAMFDVSLQYKPNDGDWSITAYVNNLTDRTEARQGAYSTQTHLYSAAFYPPRTAGLVFSAKVFK